MNLDDYIPSKSISPKLEWRALRQDNCVSTLVGCGGRWLIAGVIEVLDHEIRVSTHGVDGQKGRIVQEVIEPGAPQDTQNRLAFEAAYGMPNEAEFWDEREDMAIEMDGHGPCTLPIVSRMINTIRVGLAHNRATNMEFR